MPVLTDYLFSRRGASIRRTKLRAATAMTHGEKQMANRRIWAKAATRLEQVIEIITGQSAMYYAAARVNHAAATRAVEYCKSRAAGGREDIDREQEMILFIGDHNQSLDWIFFGDPGRFICERAEGTSSIRPPRLRVIR
jgi:hypothetical protein